jgi:GNAT superfamily N-acetyltransferase
MSNDGNAPPYRIRSYRDGDLDWIVARHRALYKEEYGWGEAFASLVAGIAEDFQLGHDPAREECWIAERDDARLGSVMLVRESETVAKLRLLLVEPEARGLGVGTGLVNECLTFARQTGYRKVTLWTNRGLAAARHIYEKAGFRLVHEEPHDHFGSGLIGQTWEREL